MSEPRVISKTEKITFRPYFISKEESAVVRRNRTTAETVDQYNRIYENALSGKYNVDVARAARIRDAYARTLRALDATDRSTALNSNTAMLISRKNNRK